MLVLWHFSSVSWLEFAVLNQPLGSTQDGGTRNWGMQRTRWEFLVSVVFIKLDQFSEGLNFWRVAELQVCLELALEVFL